MKSTQAIIASAAIQCTNASFVYFYFDTIDPVVI